MRYLTVEEVLTLHDYQIEKFGGSHGMLHLSLLESCVFRPGINIVGRELYRTIAEKAAILIYTLIKNHPFVDGNKRTGLYAMLVFLELNNYFVSFNKNELVKLCLEIADGTLDFDTLVKRLATKVHALE